MAASQNIKYDSQKSIIMYNSVDIHSYVRDVRMPLEYKVNDGTVFGSVGEVPWPSIFMATITLSGFWNQITSTGVQTTLAAACAAQTSNAFEYAPAGTDSGNTKIYGNAYVTKFEVTGTAGDLIKYSAELRADNGWTLGTY